MGKYICKECGSEEVEQKAWIDLNTEQSIDSCSDGDVEDNWCRNCEQHCGIEYIADKDG